MDRSANRLQLTVLAAEKDPERYEAMAVRWLLRVLQERQIDLHEPRWMVDRPREIKAGRAWEAKPSLGRFLEKKLFRLGA